MLISAIYLISSRTTHPTCTSHTELMTSKQHSEQKEHKMLPSDPGKHWSFTRIFGINTRWFLAVTWRGKKEGKIKGKRCAHKGTEDEMKCSAPCHGMLISQVTETQQEAQSITKLHYTVLYQTGLYRNMLKLAVFLQILSHFNYSSGKTLQKYRYVECWTAPSPTFLMNFLNTLQL